MHSQRFAVTLLLTVLLFAGCLLAQQQSATAAAQASAVDQSGDSITIKDLFSPKKDSLIGSPITLRNVEVRAKTSRQALWVGPSSDQALLVTLPATVHPLSSDGSRANVQKGDIVNITGVVQRAPLPVLLKEGWGMNLDDAPLVERSGVILNALKVEITNSARGRR